MKTRNKRVFALFMTLVMIFGTITPVFANTANSGVGEDVPVLDIDGLVISVQDQNGEKLQNGRIHLFEEEHYTETYGDNTESYSYQELIFSNKVEAGESFIPNAYLLSGKNYQLIVENGDTKTGERVVYQRTLDVENLPETLELKSTDLTKATISLGQENEYVSFNFIKDSNDYYYYYDFPSYTNQEGNVVLYVSTDELVQYSTDYFNETNNSAYLIRESFQPTGSAMNISINEDDLLKIVANDEEKNTQINIEYFLDDVSNYFISKNSYYWDIRKRFTRDNLMYDVYKNDLFVGEEFTFETGEEFTARGYFDDRKSSATNDKEIVHSFYHGSFYDEFNNYLADIYQLYNDVGQNVFPIIDEDQTIQLMTATLTEEGTHFEAYNQENTLYDLTYELYRSSEAGDVRIGEIEFTNDKDWYGGYRSFVEPTEPGDYYIKVVTPDNAPFQLNFNYEFTVTDLEEPQPEDNDLGSFDIVIPEGYQAEYNNELTVYEVKQVGDDKYANQLNSEYLDDQTKINWNNILSYVNEQSEYIAILKYSLRNNTTNDTINIIEKREFSGSEILFTEWNIDLDELSASEIVVPDELQNLNELAYSFSFPLVDNTNHVEMYWDNINNLYTNLVDGEVSFQAVKSNLEDSTATFYSLVAPIKDGQIIFSLEDTVDMLINSKENSVKWMALMPYGHHGAHLNIEQNLYKLVVNPRQYYVGFDVFKEFEKDTPWQYNWSTTINVTGEETITLPSEIENKQLNVNVNNENEAINIQPNIQSGDFYLNRVFVYRENDFYKNSLEDDQRIVIVAPPIDEQELFAPMYEYVGDFNHMTVIHPAITITNEQTNQVVYKEDYMDDDEWRSIRQTQTVDISGFKQGKYKVDFSLPTGPRERITMSNTFSIGNQNFVALDEPVNGFLTNNETITVKGRTEAGKSVKITATNSADNTSVIEKVVANNEGLFEKVITLSKDGEYSIVAATTEAASQARTITLDKTSPTKPELEKAIQQGNKVVLSWKPNSDVARYDVFYWKDGETVPQQPNRTTTNNSVEITGLENGTKYNFKVVAYDKAGNLSTSETSYTTSSFAVNEVNVKTETGTANHIKLGSNLAVEVKGSYAEGYTAKANITYNNDQTETINLAFVEGSNNNGTATYKGEWKVEEGTRTIEKVEAWIVKSSEDTTSTPETTDKVTKSVKRNVGATITGTITGANDKTQVRLVGSRTITVKPTNDGTYSFAGIPAGTYRIDVEHAGNTQTWLITNVLAELGKSISDLEPIKLPELATVTLKFPDEIKDVDSISLYGYQSDVNYQYTSFYKWKPTIQNGELQITSLAQGDNYYLYVYKEGYVPFIQKNITLEEQTSINVELDKGLKVTGKVQSEDGVGLVNANLSFSGTDFYNWARTGADGSFAVEGVKKLPFTVNVQAEGYKRKSITIDQATIDNATDTLDLEEIKLEISDYIEGQVLNADNTPVARGYATLYKDGNWAGSTRTGANGEFIFRNLEDSAGTYNVVVSNDSQSYTAEGIKAKEFVTITLGDSGSHAVDNELFATIVAPAATSNQEIVVRGTATPTAKLEVFVDDQTEAVLTIDSVARRSWDGKIQLPVTDGSDSTHDVTVKVTKDGEEVTETVKVDYIDNLPKVKNAKFTAGQLDNIELKPYESLPRYPIMENSTEIFLTVEFDHAVDSAQIRFIGEEWDMTKSNKTFSGKIPYGWRSAGNQLFEVCYRVGERQICLPLMEVMVLIDPAGYVFEGSMDNRLQGVTATVFQEEGEENWVQWNAAVVGQVNPQITGEDGRYRWDVPEGNWQVRFNKEGYEPYSSRVVPVPPPETELNIPLVRIAQPEFVSITPANDVNNVKTNASITITFDQLMDLSDTNLENITINKLTEDKEGKEIRTPVTFSVSDTTEKMAGYKKTVEEERNGETYFEYLPDESKQLAKAIVLQPTTLNVNAKYEVVIGENFADYSGKIIGEEVVNTFKTSTNSSGPIGGGSAGGGALPPVVTEATTVEKETTSDGKTKVVANVDANKLAENLKQQSAIAKVSFTVEKNAGEIAELRIPKAAFDVITNKNAKATIEVKTNEATFNLPVAEINLAELAQKLGTPDQNVTITVLINETTDSNKVLATNNLSAKAPIIDFKVIAQAGNKQETISRFNQYLVREIVTPSNLNTTNATVVRLNDDGTFTAVPTFIEGKKAIFKSFTNSKYTVIENSASFKDVLATHWAKADIEKLASKFIINGMPNGTFAPAATTTRAQFAALLTRSLGLPITDAYDGRFEDVKGNEWFVKELTAAVNAGIIEGLGDDTFAPNATVTREQAATMIARALTIAELKANQFYQSKKLDSFKDQANIATWAKSAVEKLVQAEIIDGRPDQTFAPKENMQRAEVAKMLERYLSKAKLIN